MKPNPRIFDGVKEGRISFKPLRFKGSGEMFKDVDYFELLGRKCLEMDKRNRLEGFPTDYGKYDKNCVELAKQVVKGIDSGMSKDEMNDYIQRCIDFDA